MTQRGAGTKPDWRLRLKYTAFRGLERAADLRKFITRDGARANSSDIPIPPDSHRRGSLWVFASTIGELNLIEPLLTPLLTELAGVPLTLITDRPIYHDSYLSKYPDAFVYRYAGNATDTLRLAALTPPLGLVIVEIPCLPSDGPCRFPFAAVYEARSWGAPVVLLNGWLYGYAPPSRLDALERQWFGADYLRSMDLITVQNEATRSTLLAMGADADRVHVTGNTKFDAVVASPPWTPEGRPSRKMLEALSRSGRPVVTAGCVTAEDDQALIVRAFADLRARFPNALLVMAPRHPENARVLSTIDAHLNADNIAAIRRTVSGDCPIDPDTGCLVLDTFGELKDFYAVCTAAYVGPNHNLLEPLSLGKPTSTRTGWDRIYPSYPVYAALRAVNAIQEHERPQDLANFWSDTMTSRGTGDGTAAASIDALVRRLGGATARTLPLLRKALVERISRSR